MNDIFPTGADTRFRLSHDGLKIRETHRMHYSLLETKLNENGTKTEMTYHTAVVDDAPEDMDVANVLMMGGIPMMVASREFVYRINEDGTTVFLMTTKDLQKSSSK